MDAIPQVLIHLCPPLLPPPSSPPPHSIRPLHAIAVLQPELLVVIVCGR
jgi:hypothetical protein